MVLILASFRTPSGLKHLWEPKNALVLVALATCLLAGMREDSEGWKELLFPRPQDSFRPQVRMGTTLSRWTDMCTTL